MRRKTTAQLAQSGAKRGRIARRKAEEACPHEPGEPPRPKDLTVSGRRAWNKLVKELLAARKLWKDDGPRLLALIRAQADAYRGVEGAWQRMTDQREALDGREPFPEPTMENNPEAPWISLDDFLAAVKLERDTFAERLVPGQTLVLDLFDGEPGTYQWPAGDAATVAREYALSVTQGAIPACQLLKRACTRHLEDLETGASRGIFYDRLAARNIVVWFEQFCGLKPLQPWEVWIVTSLFAWKQPSGLRRFRECYLSVGRKNGKTALAAGIGAFCFIADGEKRAEVYFAATKKDQARLGFRAACWYVEANPELKAHVKKFISSLTVEETQSVLQPLSSDVKSLDGLNPSCVLADELHEWGDREQWDKLVTGTVARPQPLVVAITTAGAACEGFAYSKFQAAEKILNGIPDDRTLAVVYQLDPDDDYRDESLWVKSNPNLGHTVILEALRKQLADVEQNPNGLNALLRYTHNRWMSFKRGRSIPPAKWDSCTSLDEDIQGTPDEMREKFLELHGDASCWAGFDLGLTEDMTAFVALFRIGDIVTCLPDFWVPEVGLLEKEKRWQIPLSEWARDDWITLVPGDIVDPDFVLEEITEWIQQRPNFHSLGFDRWNAGVAMSRLHDRTGVPVFEVPQRPSTITQPAKAFKTAVWQQKFQHLGNPVLRWMAGNVVLEEDEKHGGMMAVKLSRDEKIDGVQALLSAWATMETDPGYLKNFARGFATF